MSGSEPPATPVPTPLAGYRLLVAAVVAVVFGGILAGAMVLVLLTDRHLAAEDYLVLGVAVGLLSFGLRVLLGASPWPDILTGLRVVRREPPEDGA